MNPTTPLRDHLLTHFADCIIDSCHEGSCRLMLRSVKTDLLVIISGSAYQSRYRLSEQLCDRLIFYFDRFLTVVALELTDGRLDGTKTKRQITSGARIASKILNDFGHCIANNFIPVSLHRRYTKKIEMTELIKTKIQFQSHIYKITCERCNSQLIDIMNNNPPPIMLHHIRHRR